MNEIIKKNGFNFGVLSGLISVIITSLVYIVDLKLFTSFWLLLIIITISLTLAIVLLNKSKKELNGILTFKEAFTVYFLMSLVSVLISVGFNIILFNIIDPDVKVTLKELTIKSSMEMMEKFGAPKSEIKKAVTEIGKQDQFGVVSQIKGMFGTLVFSSIFGLILAAFFKTPNRQEI